jgi:hypothetical protein
VEALSENLNLISLQETIVKYIIIIFKNHIKLGTENWALKTKMDISNKSISLL